MMKSKLVTNINMILQQFRNVNVIIVVTERISCCLAEF